MAKILLGVSGSIAAYRSPDLVKALRARGHEVQVVLTQAGSQFVTAKTLETFSGLPVLSNDPWSSGHQGTDHIRHARWADLFLVYGATANVMAKLAYGLCDDFLSLQILATTAPVMLAPAMNVEMWRNAATQENYKKLLARGLRFVGPIEGKLACGELGQGHVADIEEIVSELENMLATVRERENPRSFFDGKKVLVSLGSMKSAIDDVRFLQNKSSGRMGIEIAKILVELGARVQLLAGLVDSEVEVEFAGFPFERFETYSEYRRSVHGLFPECDVFFSLAAVLDFEVEPHAGKLERGLKSLQLNLRPTEDLVAWAASQKQDAQKIIAFSLESGRSWQDCLERAHQKLLKKGADVIVVNRSDIAGQGPDAKTNCLYLLERTGESQEFPLASKGEVAWKLCRELGLYFERNAKKSKDLQSDLTAN